jgi:FlaA1/EpsC-like NDP-sugar epimerase
MLSFIKSRRLRSSTVVFLHDLVMITFAWYGAYWLRFNLDVIPERFLESATSWFPLVLLVQAAAFHYFHLYRGHWRFASLPDLVRIVKAVMIGTFVILAVIFVTTRLQSIPRSIFPLYCILLVGFLGFPRMLYRWVKDRHLYVGEGTRVLIVGAGRAGDMLVRDMLRDPSRALVPVGFVDDKLRKIGMDIQGVRVLGTSEQIPDLVSEHEIELIILAIPSAYSKEMQRIVAFCERSGVPFRTLPRFEDLVEGRVAVSSLRDVSIDDLLGREPVRLSWSGIRAELQGKRVLITGGGGSIGSELCRQIARIGPRSLIILEQNEFNLFEIERELSQKYPGLVLNVCLGDVTDEIHVDKLMGAVSAAGDFPCRGLQACTHARMPGPASGTK